jgi:hypothetical protein
MDITHPHLRDLHAYWQRKKAGRRLPARGDVEPSEIPRLLPWIALVEVTENPQRFFFRLAGTKIETFYGAKVSGRWLDELDFSEHNAAIAAQYAAAAQSGEPSVARFAFTKQDGRHLEYERVLLPLSSDGSKVDMLLIGYGLAKSYQT